MFLTEIRIFKFSKQIDVVAMQSFYFYSFLQISGVSKNIL